MTNPEEPHLTTAAEQCDWPEAERQIVDVGFMDESLAEVLTTWHRRAVSLSEWESTLGYSAVLGGILCPCCIREIVIVAEDIIADLEQRLAISAAQAADSSETALQEALEGFARAEAARTRAASARDDEQRRWCRRHFGTEPGTEPGRAARERTA